MVMRFIVGKASDGTGRNTSMGQYSDKLASCCL
jgi:hypothetical protein